MLYQDMLKLKAINSNNSKLAELANKLTPEEWSNKKLGNTKLSKYLLSIGLDNNDVSSLLSATVLNSTTRVVSDKDTCFNQGNSIYYASCQATDSRAKHSPNSNMCDIAGDLQHLGKTLFFWVSGNSMSVDGMGFTARAKLRIIYKDPNHTKVFGLWLDKIYGNALILLSNYKELLNWWHNDMQQTTPIYKWCADKQEIPVFIPSAANGYQDSAGTSTYYYKLFTTESLLRKAYLMRASDSSRKSKTYKYSLSEVVFNPQNGELVLPKIEDKPYRGYLNNTTRKHITHLIALFGFPTSSTIDKLTHRTYVTFNYENDIEVMLFIHQDMVILSVNGRHILRREGDETVVLSNYGEFTKAERLPYYFKYNHMIVTHDKHGFYEAWDIKFHTIVISKEELENLLQEWLKRNESINRFD